MRFSHSACLKVLFIKPEDRQRAARAPKLKTDRSVAIAAPWVFMTTLRLLRITNRSKIPYTNRRSRREAGPIIPTLVFKVLAIANLCR